MSYLHLLLYHWLFLLKMLIYFVTVILCFCLLIIVFLNQPQNSTIEYTFAVSAITYFILEILDLELNSKRISHLSKYQSSPDITELINLYIKREKISKSTAIIMSIQIIIVVILYFLN